jgi:hypothetical protein
MAKKQGLSKLLSKDISFRKDNSIPKTDEI